MKVWIDLSNSPHPLLFAPVARRLDELGHRVLITCRDNAQTLELARARWSDVEPIGGPSPKRRDAKLRVMTERIAALRRWARARRPDVALSHNSYGQIVAARSLGMPVVTAMDFEHQPANHLAFRLANAILLPEPLPLAAVAKQGATATKVRRYPGLKEELYLGDFDPDPHVLDALTVERSAGRALVVARTPPSRAAYHRMENRLFPDALSVIDRQPDVSCVILARFPEQRDAIGALGLRNCIMPQTAVDSRSLMYAADLVLGAGGTMTREAALMGVPTFTVYAGQPPAVDRWLERRGMLRRLVNAGELGRVTARSVEPRAVEELATAGDRILDVMVDAVLDTAAR